MKFSIIVPIYKVEECLERCVKSLVNQTEKDIEIILVDDGSPDKCPKMCDEFAKMDNRIKVIHKENGGLSDARNAGLDVAKGEYVLFVDSDDYITENACERLGEFAKDSVDILVGDLEVIGGTNYYKHNPSLLGKVLSSEQYLIKALETHTFPAPAWLNAYRREFLLENELFFKCGILHEDEQFTPRAFLFASTVIYTGVNFYRYIIREGSITTKSNKTKNAEHILAICDELEAIYQNVENKRLRRLLLNRLADLHLTIFRSWKLSKYGRRFVKRRFVWKNAYLFKVRVLAMIYCISPSLYNKLLK